MRINDRSKNTQQSSSIIGMRFFMLTCISFNMYVMFLFHHREGAAYYYTDHRISLEISKPQKVQLDNDNTDMLHASRERYKNRRLDTTIKNSQPQQQQTVDKKEVDSSSINSDEYDDTAKRMFHLVDRTIHTTNNDTSYLNLAIESCDKEYNNNDEYPTIYEDIATERRMRWRRAEGDDGKVNIIQMINEKLGGLYYATKLGIHTPRIFCGIAEDLPKDINTLGRKYVVKPLRGHSAQGVKVIVDGVNTLTNQDDDYYDEEEEFSYNTLVDEYGSQEETIVEELIESADHNYNGLIPPDYKFHVYSGVPEILFRVDRNEGQKCADHFDVTSSNKWKVIEGLPRTPWHDEPHCPKNTLYSDISRETEMINAVKKVASKASRNWLRIDMYDSKNGPVFGEITPWSNNGYAAPRASCVMSYLFIAHAYNNKDLDDAATVDEVKRKVGLDTDYIRYHRDDEFHVPEAREWKRYTQMEKCNKVMKAQEEWLSSNG